MTLRNAQRRTLLRIADAGGRVDITRSMVKPERFGRTLDVLARIGAVRIWPSKHRMKWQASLTEIGVLLVNGLRAEGWTA